MTFGVMNALTINVCKDADEAVKQGFNYNAANGGTPRTAVEIERAVVVREGTVNGNSTVDFQLHDEAGNKYLVMITGALLKQLAAAL
jgi:hypothetical protein